MADDNKPKTPEELGEAVGRKIEALFGDLFDDSDSKKEEATAPGGGAVRSSESVQSAPPRPPGPAARPVESTGASTKTPRPRERTPSVSTGAAGVGALLERIEALILDLDWEAEQETVDELMGKLREADRHFPKGSPGKKIVQMSYQVLRMQGAKNVSPHPMLVRLLQEGITALRQISAAGGAASPGRAIMADLTNMYKEIVASHQPSQAPPAQEPPSDPAALIADMGAGVRSLEEVTQRLARIGAALSKGSTMPGEEMARRLKTVEGMLSQRVARLLDLHGNLSQVEMGGPAGGASGGPFDGLLMVEWFGIPLAVPTSMIAAIYPLGKDQAEQFAGRPALTISNRRVPRLPLKKPKSARDKINRQASWLVHLSHGGKEYFLVADRTLGYRRPPKGVDFSKEGRLKIGNTSFSVLSPTFFR